MKDIRGGGGVFDGINKIYGIWGSGPNFQITKWGGDVGGCGFLKMHGLEVATGVAQAR